MPPRPWRAVTIGIATILEARSIVMLAAGAHKRRPVRALLEAPVSGGGGKAEEGTIAIMVGGEAAVFEALAPVMPDKVQADSGTPLWSVLMRGVDTAKGTSFSTILFFNGAGPGHGSLHAIAGAPDIQPRYQPEARRMLDWLMRRTVFTHENRIVRVCRDDLQAHQRRQPVRRPRPQSRGVRRRHVSRCP